MSDTPASTPTPSGKRVAQGFAILFTIIFVAFGVAGLGWHAGSALARLVGI